ncbi:hypothetical protein GCM10028832_01330 [Streptomyces sparsus]
MVAVCSLENDAVLDSLGVRTTTNPIQLALWAGHGPVVVFATYASLVDREDVDAPMGQRKVRGPLEAALTGGERLYGQRMDGFDLAIVDEAHGTAGDLGRPWAAIHDNQRIPADFRLYLTATPRILAAARPQKGAEGQEAEIASMADDPKGTYGAWLAELGLSEAIEREILAGFEIDVLEIRAPSPVLGESEEARRGRRLALLQTALLEHAAAYNLRTVMTFHQTVEEAAAFAEKLPETAAELYANDASDADMVASASFRPLVAVLQGLRSHDERLVEQLASRALTSGKRKVHVRRDEDGQIVAVGGEGDGEDQEDDTQAAAEAALLHFSSPRDAATIAAFLRTRVYRPESLVWLEGYQALLRWRKENETTGFYAVPYDVETEVGVTKDFPLGRWVHQQRKALRAGELEERRKTLLDTPEAGMGWEPGEEAWEEQARHAPLLPARHGAPRAASGRRVERGRDDGAGRPAHGQPSPQGHEERARQG